MKNRDEEHYKGIWMRGEWSDLIYDETGISNPHVVIEILKQYGKIKAWVQEPLVPDLLYLRLKSMFSKRIDTSKSDIKRI